jgi:hypothetical protein
MSLSLQTTTLQGLADPTKYQTAAVVATIPTTAKPQAKSVFRHIGTAGYWYGGYNGLIPTTSNYSFKLGAGEPHQLDNPPTGAISLLASGDCAGPCEWALGWKQ